MTRYSNQAGYSLIGTAIMIVVLGMLMMAGYSLHDKFSYIEKQKVTAENIKNVKEAIARYKEAQGVLPCPGQMHAQITSVNFGVGACNLATSTTGRNGAEIRIGAVPVRSLGLPDKGIVDGYGHRLIYAVTQSYTTTAADGTKPNFEADNGAISVEDPNVTGTDQAITKIAGNVIYVVISLGDDNRGAFSLDGNAANTPIAPCNDEENCNGDGTFRSSINREWQRGADTYTATMAYESSDLGYEWHVTDWNACPCDQDAATPDTTQTRTVTCRVKGTETTADDPALCSSLTRPAETRACVAYCWAFDPCPCGYDSCGRAHQVTAARCMQNDQVTEAEVEALCGHLPNTRSCTGQYFVSCGCSSSGCGCSSSGGTNYSGSSGGGGSGSSSSGTYDIGWVDNGDGTRSYVSSGGSSSSGDSGVSHGTSSKVICTHFYRRGRMSKLLWRASMEYTFKNLSPITVRGYLFWAVPYVKLMRRSKLAEAIMFPIANSRAEELAYQLGLRDKPNYAGKLVRLILEPMCFMIGLFVSEQDYTRLYTKAEKEEIERA